MTYDEATWSQVLNAPIPSHKDSHKAMLLEVGENLPPNLSRARRHYLVPTTGGLTNLAAFWDGLEFPYSKARYSVALVHWHGVSVGAVLYGGMSCQDGPPVYLSEYPLGRTPLKRIQAALAAWSETRKDYGRRHQKLAKERLSEEQAESLAVKAGRNLLIAWSRIRDVLVHYDGGTQTKWGMLEAFARASEKSPPTSRADHIYQFSGLLLGE